MKLEVPNKDMCYRVVQTWPRRKTILRSDLLYPCRDLAKTDYRHIVQEWDYNANKWVTV